MKVSAISYLVDAGPLVGLLSQTDQWHVWSQRALEARDEPLMTTETALAEVCHSVEQLSAGMVGSNRHARRWSVDGDAGVIRATPPGG